MKLRQLVTVDEAEIATEQHRKPCGDCPWRRKALNGWLGTMTIEEWLTAAHGDGIIECHTLIGAQCAGAAIYRRNTAKSPLNPAAMRLPADRQAVFANRMEFRAHHERAPTLGSEGWICSRCDGSGEDPDFDGSPCDVCRGSGVEGKT